MASAFTHGIVGFAAAVAYAGTPTPRRLWLLAAGCAIVPDADVLGFRFGIPYRSLLGHRGLSHSLAFAAVLGIVVTTLAFRELRLGSRKWFAHSLFFTAVTASHGALDALTNGGLGVAFFSPMILKRYFFPWRPIAVSPVNVRKFFGPWALQILATEVVWVWLPALALVLVALGLRAVWKRGR
ncbi:Putative membrane-bound metal-dependent hydrolase [Minicystis rosea]|nr:Putative membrane-bound metal-dependent hydrolase [Minicystis rosea]